MFILFQKGMFRFHVCYGHIYIYNYIYYIYLKGKWHLSATNPCFLDPYDPYTTTANQLDFNSKALKQRNAIRGIFPPSAILVFVAQQLLGSILSILRHGGDPPWMVTVTTRMTWNMFWIGDSELNLHFRLHWNPGARGPYPNYILLLRTNKQSPVLCSQKNQKMTVYI